METTPENSLVNGITFDEDTGACLGKLTEHDDIEQPMNVIPTNISIYFNGHWYLFKQESHYLAAEKGDSNESQEKTTA